MNFATLFLILLVAAESQTKPVEPEAPLVIKIVNAFIQNAEPASSYTKGEEPKGATTADAAVEPEEPEPAGEPEETDPAVEPEEPEPAGEPEETDPAGEQEETDPASAYTAEQLLQIQQCSDKEECQRCDSTGSGDKICYENNDDDFELYCVTREEAKHDDDGSSDAFYDCDDYEEYE